MPAKFLIIAWISMSSFLVACASNEQSRSDMELLERPPLLPFNKAAEIAATDVDESVVSSKDDTAKGMGDKVSLSGDMPAILTIKQPFASAWVTVEQALKQKNIKIADFQKDKGLYYVVYENSGLLDKIGSLFQSDNKGSSYLLTVVENGEQTQVTAESRAHNEEETVHNPDGYDDSRSGTDQSAELLQILYLAMRDELVKK